MNTVKHTEEVIYPQGIAGYAIIGIYTGGDSPPWVGPVKPTRQEAAEAYYIRACEYVEVDPDAMPQDSWHEQLIECKVKLEEEFDDILFDADMSHLFMVKVPL